MKLGNFRSLTNPNEFFSISRNGRTKDTGGDGITWGCSCDSFKQDGICKHLKCLWAYHRNEQLNLLIKGELFIPTWKGKRYFKISQG